MPDVSGSDSYRPRYFKHDPLLSCATEFGRSTLDVTDTYHGLCDEVAALRAELAEANEAVEELLRWQQVALDVYDALGRPKGKSSVAEVKRIVAEVAALRAERARIEHDPRVVAVLRLLSERMESNLRSDLLAAIRGGEDG